jgi:hypothetical protein
MSYTAADYKKKMARYEASLRIGSEVRIKGWQMHWPRETRQIVSIDLARENVVLDRPILGKKCWLVSDLAKPF